MKSILTPKFRLSYPALFEPVLNKESGKLEYRCAALFKKGENLDALKALAQETCAEKWGKDASKWPKPMRSPFRLQEERMKDGVLPEGLEEGAVFINLKASEKKKPAIVDENVVDIIDQSQIYAGCWVRAKVTCYAYGGPGTGYQAGVAFGLGNVQKMADDKPLGGGRTRPEDDFAPVSTGTEFGNASTPASIFG